MKRKTIDVQALKDYANNQLARTDAYATDEFKKGIISMIEKVLLDSGNYNGFDYVYWVTKGYNEWRETGQPKGEDCTNYVRGNMGEYSRIYS
jgi:hypothetical protein